MSICTYRFLDISEEGMHVSFEHIYAPTTTYL